MIENETPDLGTGPLTLEMAELWLLRIEDIATLERDMGYASRVVLFGLIAELAKSDVINADNLIAHLVQVVPDCHHQGEKLALQCLIDDLYQQLIQLKHGAFDNEVHH